MLITSFTTLSHGKMRVQVSELTKRYGEVVALDRISFEVRSGELFGFIGPDGAGKTSLFRILTTLLLPDEGRTQLGAYDVVADFRVLRNKIGYMPGRFSLYQDLTVEENLNFFANIFGTTLQENRHLIQDIYVQIEPFKTRRAGKLSGGMKQKLALCCALIHKPELLVLDEPTTGVDPVSRKEFWDMLGRLQAEGITILASTPYMDEASRCDRVALMQGGKILAMDSPAHIRAGFSKPLWAVQAADMHRLLLDLRTFSGTASCFGFGDVHHLTLHEAINDPNQILQFLQERGHTDIYLSPIEASIEDCFMALMHHEN